MVIRTGNLDSSAIAVLLFCANLLLLAEPSTASPAPAKVITELDDVESQLSIYPTDDEETSGLDGSKLLYSDFCITTRDRVMGDIKRTTKQLATSVFSGLFKSFEQIGLSGLLGSYSDGLALDNQKLFNDQPEAADLEAQVSSTTGGGDNEQGDGTTTAQPAEAQRSGIFGSVMSVLSYTKNAVAANVKQTLSTIKSNMGLMAVTTVLKDTCSKVEDHEREIRTRFQEVTDQLGGVVVSDLEGLNCVTTNRVLSLGKFCRMAMTAHEPISKVIAFASPSTSMQMN